MLDTDEQAFLNAIAAAPEDVAPRLIFADWLEDRDDPRAAWVRDAELFAWMGPQAENPVDRLQAAWADAKASLEYVARDQYDDRLKYANQLGRLLGRLGEPLVPYALAQFETPEPEPLIEPFLFSIAGHLRWHTAPLLALASNGGRWQQLALQTLIAGGSVSPAMLQSVLDLAAKSATERHAALEALANMPEPERGSMVTQLCELLANANADNELQETALLVEYIRIIGVDVRQRSEVLTLLTQLLSSRSSSLVEAASEQLRDVREQVLPVLGKAIRDSKPDSLPALFRYVREAAPDWVGYLIAHCLAPGAKLPTLQAAFEQLVECPEKDVARVETLFGRMLQHPQTKVRVAVVETMRYREDDGRRFLPLLEDHWDGQPDDVKSSMIYAIFSLVGIEREGLPLMMRGVTDLSQPVRHTVAALFANNDGQEAMVERLRRRMKHTDELVRAGAILGLSDFIPWDDDLIDVIHEGMNDESPRVRRAVWQGIAGKMDAYDHYLKFIRQGLRDPHPSVCQAACVAAHAVGLAEKLRPELMDLARDESPKVRAGALQALVDLAAETNVRRLYVRALQDDDRLVEGVLRGFEHSATRSEFLPEIAPHAKHANPEIRILVQRIFHSVEFEEPTPELQEIVRRGLADVNEAVVRAALTTVARNADHATFALPEIWRVLDIEWPNMDVAAEMASTLGDMPDALPELVQRVTHRREVVRTVALQALESLLEDEPERVAQAATTLGPQLEIQLPKELGENLRRAIALVGRLGPAALNCLPFLQQAIERPYFDARHAALAAIGRLGPKATCAKPLLFQTVEREPYNGGAFASMSLVYLAAHDADSLAFVRAALTNITDEGHPWDLLETISETPPVAEALVTELLNLWLQLTDAYLRERVAEALSVTGAALVPHFPRVEAILRNATTDEAIMETLQLFLNHGEHMRPAFPLLLEYANHPSVAVRRMLARAAADLPVPECFTLLGHLLNDPERGPRVCAGRALMDMDDPPATLIPVLCQHLLNQKWDGNLDSRGRTIDDEADEVEYSNAAIDCRFFLAVTLYNMPKGAAAPALPTLAKMVREKNAQVFWSVCWVLVEIGLEAVPTLQTFIKSAATADLRQFAQQELERLFKQQEADRFTS